LIRLVLPIYYQTTRSKVIFAALNWYRNVHYQTNNKVKKFVAQIIEDNIEGEPILEGKLHVHFCVYFKRRGGDGGNVRSVMEKYALDGIKKAGFIVDDNFEVIVSDSSEYHLDRKNPRIEITITKK